MDLLLDILIPRKEIYNASIEEILVEWGGEQFSQDPRKYKFQSTIYFHESFGVDYYSRITKEELNINEFIILTLEGDSLSQLELFVNNKDAKNIIEDNELIELFYKLFNSLDFFLHYQIAQ